MTSKMDSKKGNLPSLVFISHDSRDAKIADAFSQLLSNASLGMLKSFFATDKRPAGGIQFGDEWYPTLMSKIEEASAIICLLTERSVNNPWIVYEAAIAKGKLDIPVCGVAIGIPIERINAGPFFLFQNSDDSEESLTALVKQLIGNDKGIELEDDQFVRQHVQVFRSNISHILIQTPPTSKEQKCVALMLAGGKSSRWRKSIQGNSGYSLPEPPSNTPPHKSCAKLGILSLIQWELLSFLRHHIKNFHVMLGVKDETREAIKSHINELVGSGVIGNIRLSQEEVAEDRGLVASAVSGMEEVDGSYQELIVSYSDIVWSDKMFNALLEYKGADIVVLVDKDWYGKNYPKRRRWHNRLCAELAFGKDDKLEDIGEVVNRFEGLPANIDSNLLLAQFNPLFTSPYCIGEVVGIFKFSPAGARAFINCYYEVLAKSTEHNGDYIIPTPDLKENYVPDSSISFRSVMGTPLKKSLFGFFLSHVARMNCGTGITIKLLKPENSYWCEVDHWGDLCIANDRLDCSALLE